MEFNAEDVHDFAVDLAKRAGVLIREGFAKEKNIEFKTSNIDLVTEYDRKVEEFVFSEIRQRFPEHKLIGEESTAVSGSAKTDFSDDPTWIIDPIDGTLNFVHRFPYIAISIGVAVNKKPVVGVIYNPVLEHMYAARDGHGATLNGEPIHVSATTELGDALIFMEISHSENQDKQAAVRQNVSNFLPKVHGLRNLGTAALQMSLVAQGGADAYITSGVHVWDMAAGVVIVNEAGGYVSDTDGGPLDLMSRRILCTSTRELAEKIHPQLAQYTALPRDD